VWWLTRVLCCAVLRLCLLQVLPRLPLSGRWPGCSCFCFKRRKLREADEHALKTVSTLLHCVNSFPHRLGCHCNQEFAVAVSLWALTYKLISFTHASAKRYTHQTSPHIPPSS
jgi:hypothetical protein